MTQQKAMAKAQDPRQGDGDDGEDSDNDYKDDDAVVVPEPVPKDNVQATFDEIIARARNGDLNLGRKESRQEFFGLYGTKLFRKTQTYQQTLLHMIADTLGHKSLTRCIVKRDKTLLEEKDDSGKTALHIAIVKKNVDFIDVVLKEVPTLDTILQMKCEHMRNCIHVSIYHSLKKEFTVRLIKAASEKTLSAVDQDGLTPLHLAVEYPRCSETQLTIVRTLLEYGDGALDVFTKNPKGLSVYEYHYYTRLQAAKKLAESLGVGIGAREVTTRPNEETRKAALQGPKTNAKKIESEGMSYYGNDEGTGSMQKPAIKLEKGPKGPTAPPVVNGRRGSNIALSVNVVTDHPGSATSDDAASPVVGSRFAPDSAGFEPQKLEKRMTGHVPRPNRRDEESARKLQEDEKRRAEYADKISKEFKLHYLRSTFGRSSKLSPRDQLKASRFLHGSNINNINLCFDYSEAPKRILRESFIQSYDHMSFDNVLRYVTFRRIELQKPPPPTTESALSKRLPQKPKPGRGREDLTFFFDWLYQKKVQHILKVTVDDLEDPPHSDKAIEECLRRFEVETLDWRRVDLCPETLHHACRNVKELYLRWSGNRAILRAWGEPDGLPKLENLEKVHLIWKAEQTLESADRIEKYIDDFQERLDKTLGAIDEARNDQQPPSPKDTQPPKRKILVYKGEENSPNSEHLVQSGPSKTANSANELNSQSNRWLDTMDKFADEIQNVKIPSNIDNVLLKTDIKVALIDDGADPYVESLRGKIRGGESFDRGYPHENGPSPYYVSSNGHGTVMADMICRVCPMAKLYVYKLETQPAINTSTQTVTQDQISVESAALAVMAAVNQKVDIISMSWTVRETEENHESIAQLREAIKLALDARILLFCAAGDTGNLTVVEYPWSYDQRRIFRIGAATADGRVWGPTGAAPGSLSFIVPGYKVVSRNPYREGALPDDFEERTGSSIATALAAGLAALVLHCVRLGAIHTELEERQGVTYSTAVKAADLLRVKDHDNMMSVLAAIGLVGGEQKFIEVWRRFDVPTQNLKIPPPIEANVAPGANTPADLKVVAKLASSFVSGIPERIT